MQFMPYNVTVRKRGKGLAMKYTTEYQVAAYKMCGACDVAKMTDDELKAAKEQAETLKFYAQMSDDYSVTRREIAEVNQYMKNAYEEMHKRGF